MEREPSCEDMVFCLDTGTYEEEEDVDARDGACSMAMDIARPERAAGRNVLRRHAAI